jgi:energy-coupling factor transporter ATP-binding protein EcfA2
MTKSDTFPQELLKQSRATRKAYFTNFTVAHPALKEATQDLRRAIFGLPGSLILVYGPTGAGKTTLHRRTEIRITEELKPELEKDPGRLPVVSLDAIAATSGTFSWLDFFRRLLLKMSEPQVDKKRFVDDPVLGKFNFSDRTPESILRLAAERALAFRKPAALLIDEAQHMGKTSSGQKLHAQLDAIKSFSTVTKMTIVMCGTYELLAFRNLSAQLSRRSVDVHLRRYDARIPRDIEAFKNVLFAFQRHLPVKQEPALLPKWEYFYERTTGTIGVLKDWLIRALEEALEQGDNTVTESHLTKTAPSLATASTMALDNLYGEQELKESKSALAELRQSLGLDTGPGLKSSKPDDEHNPNQNLSGARHVRRAGQRNPKRDPVGQPMLKQSGAI